MDFYKLQNYFSGQYQQTTPPSSLSLMGSHQKHEGEALVPDTSNLLTNSLLVANGGDPVTSSSEMPYESWSANCSIVGQIYDTRPKHQMPTPPPEASGFPPSYHYPFNYGTQPTALPVSTSVSMADCYLRGSSLDESPLSSPGSADGSSSQETQAILHNDVFSHGPVSARSRSPLVDHVYGITSTQPGVLMSVDSLGYKYGCMGGYGSSMVTQPEILDSNAPKGVKMPQRKGGIQLWQFLYSLLTNPESKYRDIIEWTSNVHEREFRMLEPEAIAVWWGHHKNKPNMSYDKFSRSLRYYYDKGILKKIPGERYVYRFLIDPEHMYRHIGTSDCRPKLKPMPQAAKVAMTKYQKEQNLDFKRSNSPIITPAPERLVSEDSNVTLESTVSMTSVTTISSYSFGSPSQALQAGEPLRSSTGNLSSIPPSLLQDDSDSVPMKRTRSLDCAYESPQHQTSPSSYSLPASYEYYAHPYSPGRSSVSPVATSSVNYPISTSPQVMTSMTGQTYDTYTSSQMDMYSSSVATSDYYTPNFTNTSTLWN